MKPHKTNKGIIFFLWQLAGKTRRPREILDSLRAQLVKNLHAMHETLGWGRFCLE